ncbi:hypothetical protein Cgig2_024038 [Carnegiea gigantea]|uniref:Mitochondrial import inner membrane translocase subunit TIM17-2-like n=1 Tax=Carnegiea gigantea TaxID=171969 RepID=A0A9Q1KKF7_9CARY|nr:hypothetical protein Cgig2_024038 [Carnegiea gigantea]
MGTPETSREPCPDRILDDIGGAFAMGAIGGSVYHFIKGSINTPKGERVVGGIQTMRMKAPRTGGGFAVWGGLFSTFDCAMVYARQKEDPWNSIFAGAATGGFLQMRQGFRSASKSAAFGGVLLALIEGAGIMVNRLLSPPPQIVLDDPNMAGMGMPTPAPGFGHAAQAQAQAQQQSASGLGSSAGEANTASGPAWFGGWFGGGKKQESSSSGGSETKVLESFDSPTPMPTFEYKGVSPCSNLSASEHFKEAGEEVVFRIESFFEKSLLLLYDSPGVGSNNLFCGLLMLTLLREQTCCHICVVFMPT